MNVLLIHLSDIHIKTAEDPVFMRVPALIDAVKNLEPSAAAVIFVVSGDTVYSGSDDQFLLACEFFTRLKVALAPHLAPETSISFVTVPGNHDCDFSEKSEARKVLLEAVRDNHARICDVSVANIILAPLDRYFQFSESIDVVPYRKPPTGTRAYWEHELKVGTFTLLFRCFNSAGISEVHEKPGTLAMCTKDIPGSSENATTSIGVVHHPYNWLQPSCAREFRAKAEALSDFILTGHEHAVDKRETRSRGAENVYLEGGVLQESADPKKSEFYAIVVDLAQKKQRILAFALEGEAYRPLNCTDPQQYHLWEHLAQNRLRFRDAFKINDEFSGFIDDPEITLTHNIKGLLKLSDIFLFPDLKRVNIAGEKKSKIVPGDSIPEFIKVTPCVFIVGDDLSGKTALAKRLFSYLKDAADVPVYIDLGKNPMSTPHVAGQLEAGFQRCYTASAIEAYRQCDRSRRVVILDNYHKLRMAPRDKVELLHALRKQAFRVIVFAHDLEISFQDLTEGADAKAGELPFVYYSILPFSVSRRTRLVERWLMLGGDAGADPSKFVISLTRICDTINTLIGKNYVPAYPAYVLSVLQATEAGTEVNIEASTHGYLYELFIKTTITKYGKLNELNVVYGYLSHVAYAMFVAKSPSIKKSDLIALHSRLHAEYEVLPDFASQTEQLVEVHMLTKTNDSYAFRHKYIYYYFLASYFEDRIGDSDIRAHIQELANSLYREESANTLLFLAHLTKDRFILDVLLQAANSQYPNIKPAELDGDVMFLNQINGSVEKLKLVDQSLADSRAEYLASEDDAAAQQEEFEKKRRADMERADSLLGRLNAAIKTIQILGQVLKNFPIDIGKADKDRIIQACCDLGRRSLADYLEIVQSNSDTLMEEMMFLISRRRPGLEPAKVKDKATLSILALCELFTSGMIGRVTQSIGSNQLQVTYDRIFAGAKAPVARMVYIALHLDHYESFPEQLIRDEIKALEKNPFSFRVLRFLVARHLALFPVDFRLKQRLSELFFLEYERLKVPRPEQRLLH